MSRTKRWKLREVMNRAEGEGVSGVIQVQSRLSKNG